MARRGRPRHPDVLTPREWEVLELLREGLSNEEIGARLDITERTAKYHVSEILTKLGVETRQEAARWPGRPAWWPAAVAPLGWLGRAASSAGPVLTAGAAAVIVAALGGLALLVLLLVQDGEASVTVVPLAEERIAFAAGGSIYTVAPDGSDLREVVPGDRESAWNAAPALSPDGTTLAFTRDFEIWLANADGSDARRLAEVADLVTPPGASNPSLRAQSVAWSPDGERLAYVLGRIGGSGVQDVWVMRADGSERRRLFLTGISWVQPFWLDAERIAVYENAAIRVFGADGEEEEPVAVEAEQPFALSAVQVTEEEWLVGPITSEGPITFGSIDDARKTVGTGVAPALSPEGLRFAYWQGDSLFVADVDGSERRAIFDLGPVGGRDRFFGEQPACVAVDPPACSYRLPVISWSSGSLETLRAKTYRDDALGVEFEHPAGWSAGAQPMPYASCVGCVVVGPEAEFPLGVSVFAKDVALDGPECGNALGGCPVTAFVGIRALPRVEERQLEVAGGPAWQQQIERQAPLGLAAETGDNTTYGEVWTVLPLGERSLFVVAFWRSGDAAAEEEALAGYELALESLRFLSADR